MTLCRDVTSFQNIVTQSFVHRKEHNLKIGISGGGAVALLPPALSNVKYLRYSYLNPNFGKFKLTFSSIKLLSDFLFRIRVFSPKPGPCLLVQHSVYLDLEKDVFSRSQDREGTHTRNHELDIVL